MKTFVISLARSSHRRVEMEKQLAAAGLPFTFFDAVDGSADPPPTYPVYDPQRALWRHGRAMSPGELGCYASHEALWKIAADTNEPILIMEDDIVIHPRAGATVAASERLVARYGVLRLATIRKRKGRIIARAADDLSVVRFSKGLLGLLCYAVHPDAARKLLAASHWIEPVDEYVDKFWVHGVPIYALMPLMAEQSAERVGGSIIGVRETTPLTALQQVRRETYRLMGDARRATANASDWLKTAATRPASLGDTVWSL